MNQAAIFESELSAFALPAGLDRPPPENFADLESRRLDDSLDALDVMGLSAPVLALNAADFEAAMLFADPPVVCNPTSSSSHRRAGKSIRALSPKMLHKTQHHPHHHSKKASRKQVHELQVMVNTMQVQVDGASAEIQQLAQLVGQIARQRECEQQQQRQLFEQQRQRQAQVERDCEQFERQQLECKQEAHRF